MNKLCLLLLFCAGILKTYGQAGPLDSTFGIGGVQATAFFSNANLLDEQGRSVLASTNGDVFVAVLVGGKSSYTRIAKYLPDGRLDSSYGNAGYSIAANLNVNSAAFQGDKIVVSGYAGNSPENFALARYTSDGVLDSSFGKKGRVVTYFNDSAGQAYSIALQGNKIIVGGYIGASGNFNFALVRYTADGVLDSSFGENGRVTTEFNNPWDEARAIAIQGEKIIAVGYTANFNNNTSDFALARYTVDGRLDSSFGVNGKVTTDINDNSYDEARSVTLQGNKIIVAGNSLHNTTTYFALTRYTADGVLDSSFGQNGKVTTGFDKSDAYAYSVALQEDKITAAGYTYSDIPGFTSEFALARFTADGALDSSFGENGKVTTDFNNSDNRANSIVVQGNKVIVAGLTQLSNYYNDFALARYTVNGTLDASFGVNGKLTGHFPSSHTFYTSTAMQGNKIVAAGYAEGDNYDDFALARYTAEGILDSSFGQNGKVLTDFGSVDEARSVILQGDKIIAGGSSNGDFALARYTADGKLDSTFGENGKVTTDFNNFGNYAYAMTLQGDKIILAGDAYSNAKGQDFALARYTANGTLDSSFGKNGKVTTDFGSDYESAHSIALQGDKIVVAGYTYNANGGNDFALARYTADGKLDATFGKNGKVITDFSPDDGATSIVIQGDKIIVSGSAGNYPNYDFAVLRYTADGILDPTFGENGIVTTDFHNSRDGASTTTLQDDKIILAGSSGKNFALARYTANGTLDATFGKNGKVTTRLKRSAYINAIALHQNKLYAVGTLTIFTGETYGVVAAYQLETPEPAIRIADVTLSESKKQAIVTVRLTAPTSKIVRVHFATRDKTAVHNEDYRSISGPLFFIPGVNTTAKIIIPIVDDNQQESKEQFEILLSSSHNASIQDSIGVVTIIDNDDALIIKQENTLLHINASPNPASDVFTVQLSGSHLKERVSVRVYDVNGRLVEERSNISIGQSIRLGDRYKPGTYIIEAAQGMQKVQTKVIKSSQ